MATLDVDVTGIERGDMSGMVILYELAQGRFTKGVQGRLIGLRPELQKVLAAFCAEEPEAARRPDVSLPERLGASILDLLERARGHVVFTGGVVQAFATAARRPALMRWSEVGRIVETAGVDALPIVSLVSLLTGFIIAFEAAQPPCVVITFEAKQSVNPTPGSSAALDEQVRRGLRAVITVQGITGSSYLSLDTLDPVKNPPLPYTWKPRNTVIPSAESQLGHIVASVEKTLANLEKFDVERLNARLERTLQSADSTFEKLSRIDAVRMSEGLTEAASSTRAAAIEFRALARESSPETSCLRTCSSRSMRASCPGTSGERTTPRACWAWNSWSCLRQGRPTRCRSCEGSTSAGSESRRVPPPPSSWPGTRRCRR